MLCGIIPSPMRVSFFLPGLLLPALAHAAGTPERPEFRHAMQAELRRTEAGFGTGE